MSTVVRGNRNIVAGGNIVINGNLCTGFGEVNGIKQDCDATGSGRIRIR